MTQEKLRETIFSDQKIVLSRECSGICLNMIVKNETAVLERLFLSVASVVDYFVIVDTGSTDNTPEYIMELSARLGLPGEVHFRDWVNFGHNRQQALDIAVSADKGHWLLFIDADEELKYNNLDFIKNLKIGTTYKLEKHNNKINIRYALPNLIDITSNHWQWRGAVHECIVNVKGIDIRENLDDSWIIFHTFQGARSQGITQKEKFLRDAVLLEAELLINPTNSRSRFYLAQSYRNANEPFKAMVNYSLRVKMGGWQEEVFYSLYQIARLMEQLNHTDEEILAAYAKATDAHPKRAEAIHAAARFCRVKKLYTKGYQIAKSALKMQPPNDALFSEYQIYTKGLLDEFSVNAYWAGYYSESLAACLKLIEDGFLSNDELERVKANAKFTRIKLEEKYNQRFNENQNNDDKCNIEKKYKVDPLKQNSFDTTSTLQLANKINIISKYTNNSRRKTFHVLGIPHTITLKEYSVCAFTQKVLNLCRMLKSLGHEVFHYGHEDSIVDCTEHVTVITKQDHFDVYGEHDWKSKGFPKFSSNDLVYRKFGEKAVNEINKRKKRNDFLLCPYGGGHKAIADQLSDLIVCEPGIGYPSGHFARFKIFESYAVLHAYHGLNAVKTSKNNFWYDVVIPNYYDIDDFEYSFNKDDYILFMGRVSISKGVHIAIELANECKQKLIIAGPDMGNELLKFKGFETEFISYVGQVGPKQRSDLLSRAKCVLLPSTFLEPFCGVHVEAMLCGTPVISSDWGAFAEYNLHGYTGFRCQTFDQFVRAIRNIDQIDPSFCNSWASKNFSIDRVATMYDEYFDNVMEVYTGRGWYSTYKKDLNLNFRKNHYPKEI
jgi:glycosyltransferase involved in cell wall biosynthesis